MFITTTITLASDDDPGFTAGEAATRILAALDGDVKTDSSTVQIVVPTVTVGADPAAPTDQVPSP